MANNPKQRSGLFSWTANQDFAGGFSTESLYGLAATGTTQGTAATASSGYSQFTAVPSGSGCIMPAANIRGRWFVIDNAGSNALNVYPAVGTTLGLGINTPYSLPAGDAILVISSSFNITAQVYNYVLLSLGASGGGGGGGVPPTRQIIAGGGLVGGGDLSVDRTLAVAANADGSIAVNAHDIQVGVLATDGQHGNRGGGSLHALASHSVPGFMSAYDKSKIDGFVNILDYGADPTGVVDAAPIIQAALDGLAPTSGQAASVLVYFPRGTYKLGSTVVIRRRVIMFGDGMFSTILQPVAGVTGLYLKGGFDSGDGGRADESTIRDLSVWYASQTTFGWQAGHSYTTGQTVYAVTNKNYACVFVATNNGTTGGSEPAAFATATENGLVANRTVVDGSVTWRAKGLAGIRTTCRATFDHVFVNNSPGNGIHIEASVGAAGAGHYWSGTHAYNPGDIYNNNGLDYICTIGGTSAASGGPTGTGNGIVDGTVTWNWYGYDTNANGWAIVKCNSYNSATNSLFIQGSDTNAGACSYTDFENTQASYPLVYDNSFLGNTYTGCEGANSGGGSYWMLNNNAAGVLTGCYSEGGSGVSQINHPNIVLGGQHAAGFSNTSDGLIITDPYIHGNPVFQSSDAGNTSHAFMQTSSGGNYLFNIGNDDEGGVGSYCFTLGTPEAGGNNSGWWTWRHANLDNRQLMAWSGATAAEGPGRIMFPRGFYIGNSGSGQTWITNRGANTAPSGSETQLPIADRGSFWLNRFFQVPQSPPDSAPGAGVSHGTWGWQIIGPDATSPIIQTLRWPHFGANNQYNVSTSTNPASPYNISWNDEPGVCFTNTTASAKQYFLLPQDHGDNDPDIKFSEYSFYVQNSNGIRVTAVSGVAFSVGSVSTATGGYLESTTAGSWLKVKILGHTNSPRPNWVVTEISGVWTDGSSTFPTPIGSVTTGNITLSVSTSGSDGVVAGRPPVITGGDYSSLPFATPQAAHDALPKNLNHDVVIKGGAGAFAGFVAQGFSGAGRLRFAGSTALATLVTGPNSGTAGAGTTPGTVVQPTGAINWTASDLRDHYMIITSGGGASGDSNFPTVRAIKANSTGAFSVDTVPGMDNTTVFQIVDFATILTNAPGLIYGSQQVRVGYVEDNIHVDLSYVKIAETGGNIGLYGLNSSDLHFSGVDLSATSGLAGSVVGCNHAHFGESVLNGIYKPVQCVNASANNLVIDTLGGVLAQDILSLTVGADSLNTTVTAVKAINCNSMVCGLNANGNTTPPLDVQAIGQFSLGTLGLTGTVTCAQYALFSKGGTYNVTGASGVGSDTNNTFQVEGYGRSWNSLSFFGAFAARQTILNWGSGAIVDFQPRLSHGVYDARSSDSFITDEDTGKTITNAGAGADVNLTLPFPLIAGQRYKFTVVVNHYLKVTAVGNSHIYLGDSAGALNGFVRSTNKGSTIEIETDGTDWYCLVSGTWLQDV